MLHAEREFVLHAATWLAATKRRRYLTPIEASLVETGSGWREDGG